MEKIEKKELLIKTDASGKITGKLDIVAHSMGFAHAAGMISEIKGALAAGNKLGRFYIIAPENGCSGAVTLTDFEAVWHYGSNETEEKNYYQDGIAPQCPISGTKVENRVDYPLDGSAPRGFMESHSVVNYNWIFTLPQKGAVVKR